MAVTLTIASSHSVAIALFLSKCVTLGSSLVWKTSASVVVVQVAQRPRVHAEATILSAKISVGIRITLHVGVAILSVINWLVISCSEGKVAYGLVGVLSGTDTRAHAMLEPIETFIGAPAADSKGHFLDVF